MDQQKMLGEASEYSDMAIFLFTQSSQRSGFFEFAGNKAGEGQEIQTELESPMIHGANHMVS